ncbi:MAG TPA: FCD domain-containing protein [Streptosporangiaceae bacterium]|nr:FCD domain-containing protein [Streptosporangiaceae bacterium]
MPADLRYRLAELILAESARTGLGPGSRLPTERQLAADLGASRTSVRQALAVLEAQGRISREVGRGTFLRPGQGGIRLGVPAHDLQGLQDLQMPGPARQDAASGQADRGRGGPRNPAALRLSRAPESAAPDGGQSFSPADVMTIRRLLEPLAMPLVVAWATAGDFREMDRCLAGGNQARSYDEFEDWDLALHRSIMTASQSPLLVQLYAVIETARHGHSWGDLKRRSASRERRERYQADHGDLVAALRARDADRATEAMRVHLARVNSDLFAGTA